MIRVGHIVERTSGKQNGMRAGHTDEVIRVHSNGREVALKNYGTGHAISKLWVVSGTYAVNDSVIRVGDTVEVLLDNADGSFFSKGDQFVVERIDGSMAYYGNTSSRKALNMGPNYVYGRNLKKINNGARPVSGNTNTNTHEQVSEGIDGEGYGCSEYRPVRAQGQASRIATGESLDWNPRKAGGGGAAVGGR